MWDWTWADYNIALTMKQTQLSLGRIMEAYLLPVKLKLFWLRVHRSVSLLSVTPWLCCWKDRKGMQFIESFKDKMLVKMYCPVFWLIVYVASLIQSYSPICFICPFLSNNSEDLGFVISLTKGWTLFSCFIFSATMWSLPHWSLSSSSASSRSPTYPPPTCLC